ncbi:MAG: DUF374 domain-containing protein [bacterium]
MIVQWLKLLLAPLSWRLLVTTVRLRGTAAEAGFSDNPVIFACLHRDMLPALLYVRSANPTLLVSRSGDGDILRRTLLRDGFGFVRGSTGNEGSRAFRRLLNTLRQGRSIGLAVDGPKGPFGEVYEGVIQLSRLARRPIVPLVLAPGSYWKLGTWDQTIVPRPFENMTVLAGEQLQVEPEADAAAVTRWQRRLAAALLGETDPPPVMVEPTPVDPGVPTP